MKIVKIYSVLMMSILLLSNVSAQDDEIYEGVEFDMPKVEEPAIPNNKISITEFGAVGDGIHDNTAAFEKAIDAISALGGGMVSVPRGVWLTGPIGLKNHINLHLEAGALIVFSPDKSKYPLVKTSFEGLNTYRSQSPIYGNDLEDVAITGDGIIDGSGDVWRPVKKGKMTSGQWNKLVKSGGVLSDDERIWYPSEAYKSANKLTKNFNVPPFETREEFEAIKDFLRPVMVSLVNCKRVLLDGPTFQNSPAWNIHPLMCEDVTIRNLTVRNPWYSQNGDGLDLESCKNVVIYNNSFDVGDDAICFKSGKNEDGRKRGIPTENVIVKNNIVYHGHGGFVVGSEMSGDVRNVHVSNCTFIGTDVGLRFKSTRGRGGIVENIYISHIDMINIPTEAIRFNLFYGGQSPILEEDQEGPETTKPAAEPVTEETPSFRKIYMHDIHVSGSKTAAMFQGLPEMKLHDVELIDAVLEAENGVTMINVKNIKLQNVEIRNSKGKALTIYNGGNVKFDQIKLPKTDELGEVQILGDESYSIEFNNCTVNDKLIKAGSDVKPGAYSINN